MTALHTIGTRPTLTAAHHLRGRCHRLGLTGAVVMSRGPAWAVVAYTTAEAARACRMSLRASDDRRVLDEVRADETPPPARFVVLA
jgi:hypothetical protein